MTDGQNCLFYLQTPARFLYSLNLNFELKLNTFLMHVLTNSN